MQRSGPVEGTDPPPPVDSVEREPIPELDLDLGPIPKSVVFDDGVAGELVRAAGALPRTTVGLRLLGGNMLRPETTAALRQVPSVRLELTLPVLPVHLGPMREARRVREVWVSLRPEERLPPDLDGALERVGPVRRGLRLGGPLTAERIHDAAALPRAQLAVVAEETPWPPEVVAALAGLPEGRLEVEVPARVPVERVRGLRRLAPARITLLGEANHVSRAHLEAAAEVAHRVRVRLDDRLQGADLARLRGTAGLEVEVEMARGGVWVRRALDLLRRTEGDRKPR